MSIPMPNIRHDAVSVVLVGRKGDADGGGRFGPGETPRDFRRARQPRADVNVVNSRRLAREQGT